MSKKCDCKKELDVAEFKETVKSLRMFLAGQPREINLEVQQLIIDTLTTIIDHFDKDGVSEIAGDLMFIFLLLEDMQHSVIDPLIKELKLKMVRILKSEPKVLRGLDNTEIFKDARDEAGYITDLSYMVEPAEVQRIEHRNPYECFLEEIYIDALGRYFRKITPISKAKEETEDAIAEDIMADFTAPSSPMTCATPKDDGKK